MTERIGNEDKVHGIEGRTVKSRLYGSVLREKNDT